MPTEEKTGKGCPLTCPFCDAEIAEASFPYCQACEKVVAAKCPKCGKPVSHDKKVCPNCGAKIQR